MRIIPVIDLLGGQVVRGVAGRRSEYRPIVSKLTASTLPLDVARAFRDLCGFSELYLADLDAIAGRPPALAIMTDLLKEGFDLWADAGIGVDGRHVDALAKIGVQTIVLGLECKPDPGILERYLRQLGSERLVFSLDLLEGKPLGSLDRWKSSDPADIARQAIHLGLRRILVLDLAGVGVGQGSKTSDLCRRLRGDHPSLAIATGGGIRDQEDLRLLEKIEVDQVLVASALHDGRLLGEPGASATGAQA